MLPKIVFTDIDGVWTDGGMYYSTRNMEIKKYNTSDSAGVLFLRHYNIPLVVITGEDNASVRKRVKKLKISYSGYGVINKLDYAQKMCDMFKISLADAAFIGDDIFDMPLLREVSISACPVNASEYVKKICKHVIPLNGGQGVFRYFIEKVILGERLTEDAVQSILEKTKLLD